MPSVLARQANGQFQLTITIPADQVQSAYRQQLAQAQTDLEVPGFRKGKAPLDKVEEKLDRTKIYQQSLQQLLPQLYLAALQEHQLHPIVDPHIEILTPEPDSDSPSNDQIDWQVRATSAEKPVVDTTDYQKKLKGALGPAIWTPDKAATPKNTPPDPNPSPQSDADKKQQQLQKLLSWLTENIPVTPADMLVEQHSNHLLSQFLEQLQKLGVTLDQYLSSTHKKAEDLRAEYAQRARTELQLEFIINALGQAENITVSDAELDQLISTAPDPQTKANLQKPEQKQQLSHIIFRQKTLDRLLVLSV